MGEEEMKEPEETRRAASEKMQRNMEFIVQQQAQFAADMQRLEQTQTRAEQRWERTEESIRLLLTIAEAHEREITELTDAQTRLSDTQSQLLESQARTDRQIAELTDAQKRLTDAQTRLSDAQTRLMDAQTQSSEFQAKVSASLERLSESQARTDKQMAETDERINALVNMMERIISEGRNGRQG